MEINKQLFENILLGKLTGKLVLRSGATYSSADLHRNYNKFRFTHPYIIGFGSYTPKGIFYVDEATSGFDIIDFIPDTNMKENELTIEIPNGKIVDWDESKKQNKIILKDKQMTYKDITNYILEKHQYEYISPNGELFLTNHIHKCLEAKNKLITVAKYLNGEWKPGTSSDIAMIIVGPTDDIIVVSIMNGSVASNCGSIWFKTEKLAQQAIEILGEETVKLALEPLGI